MEVQAPVLSLRTKTWVCTAGCYSSNNKCISCLWLPATAASHLIRIWEKREVGNKCSRIHPEHQVCFGIPNKSLNSTWILLSAVSHQHKFSTDIWGKNGSMDTHISGWCGRRRLLHRPGPEHIQDSQVLTASPGWDQRKIHSAVTPVHLGSVTLWAKLVF